MDSPISDAEMQEERELFDRISDRFKLAEMTMHTSKPDSPVAASIVRRCLEEVNELFTQRHIDLLRKMRGM